MYRTLFDLAGWAIFAWLLLVFLPRWRVTRWAAESAIVPVYLSAIYLVGITAVLREQGPGMMASFGSAEGVLGLLRTESVALVSWIHILAFDQVIALLIYRDNMRYRFIPLPLQSVLLFATLMLGPVGFLTYWLVRTLRSRRLGAWGERQPPEPRAPRPEAPAPAFGSLVNASGLVRNVRGLLARTPSLVALGTLAFVYAGITVGVAAVNGGWMIGTEGRLLEAVRFDVAVGIYIFTVALMAPLAPMTPRRRRRWLTISVVSTAFALTVETVQSWRGLDPRFTAIGGVADQVLAGLLFVSSFGLLALYAMVGRDLFSRRALPDHPALRVALRYGVGGVFMAFAGGLVMTVLRGRGVGAGGDLMPLHAVGFHALHAVPLVALLVGGARSAAAHAPRVVHVAGTAWMAVCVGLGVQALTGRGMGEISPAMVLAVAGALAWVCAVAVAARGRLRARAAGAAVLAS